MGKKRGKAKSSREDDEFELTGPSCRHIKKGTDQTLLKKLSGNSDWTRCQDCKQEENKENIDTALDQDSAEETAGTWMCLKCGHRGCGRNSENQHAIRHYETPHSDPHCLVISLDSWSVWCYICDDEVQYSRKGHLAQLITNLKKQASADTLKKPEKQVKEEKSLEAQQKTETVGKEESEQKENMEKGTHQKKDTKKESVGKSQKSNTTDERCGVLVKGLSNLGNTCFFNAVIQNLSQTHLLRKTLNKVTEDKMTVSIKPSASLDLEPVELHLGQPGSLTLAMCHLLNEIQESKKSVVTPRELFTQVCKKAARFKGFQQQDSQELLRYLLDGMRTEELKRIGSAITEVLKQSREITDEEQKKIVKDYEKNGFPKNFVDQVFGGEMTSTIMCQECKTVSVVTEMFLDLSLPVFDEAYRKNAKKGVQKARESSQDGRHSPALTSRNDDTPTGDGSKHQQKKAKKQAKKQAKRQKQQQKLEGRVTLDSLTSSDPAEGEQTEVAADSADGENAGSETCEDNASGEQNPTPISVSKEDQSANNSVQFDQEKDDDVDTMSDRGLPATSGVSNHFTVLSEEQPSKDSAFCEESSNVDQEEEEEEEEEEDTQLVSGMEKINLDDAFIGDSDSMDQSMEDEDRVQDAKEYTVVNQDPELAFHTLATRATPEKQECSVQSCLFQFTEVETLTQNNSLLCVTCTERDLKKNKNGGSKKNIYTDALKQMLISSPPPVLTLHLKRFQQEIWSHREDPGSISATQVFNPLVRVKSTAAKPTSFFTKGSSKTQRCLTTQEIQVKQPAASSPLCWRLKLLSSPGLIFQ
ncbi:ubiquitin carboxyl-terminal hydrolase 16 isoform 2-T2 [Pholidichthys leucotaenia]